MIASQAWRTEHQFWAKAVNLASKAGRALTRAKLVNVKVPGDLDDNTSKPLSIFYSNGEGTGFIMRNPGFSLVEILITLSIIGILTLFTVPKLISTPNSTASSKQTAMAKDAAFMILSAYEQFRAANSVVSTASGPSDLTPYMNYVSVKTTGLVDATPGNASYDCANPVITCLTLHNGSVLFYNKSTIHFDSTLSTDAIWFIVDPDGSYSGSTADSASKSLLFFLYYNGKLKSWNQCLADTRGWAPGTGYQPNSISDPSWFSGF